MSSMLTLSLIHILGMLADRMSVNIEMPSSSSLKLLAPNKDVYKRQAQDNPSEYKDLMVRVAGYSALFTPLDKALQDDIIERTEHAV